MSTLSTTASVLLNWTWTESFSLGDIVDKARVNVSVPINDAAIADIAWQDGRTIAAGAVDVFDLSALPHRTLGVQGLVSLTSVAMFFLRNRTTTAGARLRVGTPADGTFNTYAVEVGRGSLVLTTSLDGWTPGVPLRVANISAVPITYDIALIGQGETVA